MKKLVSLLFVVLFVIAVLPQSKQQFGEIGDLRLENGSVIENCKIGYRTFGKLNNEKSNAIIYPTWFGGNSYELSTLISPTKLIDSTGYFIIAIDALGNGISSSPSNSETQKDEKFPVFSIHDMVVSEYQLVTKVLGINHLFAAIGGSMGSMQVFEWLVSYPGFVDKAVPYVATPQMTPFDMLHWTIRLNTIETGHKYGVSEKEIMKSVNLMGTLLGKTPEGINTDYTLSEFIKFLEKQDKEPSKIFTSYNFASQLRAMLKHDISKNYDNKLENAANAVKAKVFIIVNEKDLMVNPKTSLDFAKMINAETLILRNKNGHLAVGNELEKCRNAIKAFLDK